MTAESGQRLTRLPTKEAVMAEAKRGMFNRNPLLTTPHEVACKECGGRQTVVFLDYVQAGAFELGKTETVDVVHAAPTLTGLEHTVEQMTPLIIQIQCNRCGSETSYSPLSVEYLLFTMQRNDSTTFYI
jgi:hypothetical protein